MPRTTGTYETTSVGGENVQAFIPHPLPPVRPQIRISGDLAIQLRSAETSLAKLEAARPICPKPRIEIPKAIVEESGSEVPPGGQYYVKPVRY